MNQDSDHAIAHEVLRSIRRIVRRISEYSKYLSHEVGLTVPQLMCLKAVGEFEEAGNQDITVASIAERVQLSAGTVSRIIDRLVRVDLISRTRTAKDRRKVCLTLTESGLERFQALPTPLQEEFISKLLALPREERLVLLSSLQRLSSLMDAEKLDVEPILHTGEVIKAESA